MRQHLKRAGKSGWRFFASLISTKARRRAVPSTQPGLELLERRDVPTVFFQPTYVLLQQNGLAPQSTSGPTGTTPTQIRHAYGFDSITFNGGSTAGDGSGETIAIVDAYDDPNIANDLHQFDVHFGLPDPTFTKVNEYGGSSLPAANSSWIGEIALDVEWAHAIAPGAKILLVEANSSSSSDLFPAVHYAAGVSGVVAVSMSWGGSEFGGETGYDSTFTTPSGHAGVTFVASSGDSGAPPIYPSISPNVLAVGGTTLNVDSAGDYLSESSWSGSGGGISTVESQPSYQNGVVTQSSTYRTAPDVSYDANPYTGFPVYDSYNNPVSAPWVQYGGTSDAAPQWAALIAIADQGRATVGLGSLDGPSQTLPMLYSLPSSDFHDITSGSSDGTPSYSAGTGYDLVTGRGTPAANLIVNALVGSGLQVIWNGSPVADGSGSVSFTALAGSTAQQTFTIKNSASATLTLSDPIALPSGFSLVSDFGSHTLSSGQSTTFVVQLNTATTGTYSGTVSFGNSTSSENPFTFTLSGTVSSSTILPNTSSAFAESGTGWLSWPGGYSGAYQYHHAGTGSNTASWTLTGLPSASYAIQATWNASSGHANNAPFLIYDGSTLLQTVTVNQQAAPSGTSYGGYAFQTLATVNITSGTLKVVLTDNGNGDVVADALRLAEVVPQPVAVLLDGSTTIANGGSDSFGTALAGTSAVKTFTVKNTGTATLTLSGLSLPSGFTLLSGFGSTSLSPGASTTFVVGLNTASAASYSGTVSFSTNDPSNTTYSFTVSGTVGSSTILSNTSSTFSETGSGWLSWSGGYSGNYQYHHAGTGADTALWTLTGLASGSYTIQVTWNASSNHANNATYLIYDGSTLVQTVTVNQQAAPSGSSYGGYTFQTLATVNITSGTLKVVLTDNGNGDVVADAVRITKN